jgi:hypothetical protein
VRERGDGDREGRGREREREKEGKRERREGLNLLCIFLNNLSMHLSSYMLLSLPKFHNRH